MELCSSTSSLQRLRVYPSILDTARFNFAVMTPADIVSDMSTSFLFLLLAVDHLPRDPAHQPERAPDSDAQLRAWLHTGAIRADE
jgi:hypothetical protein